MVSLIKLKVVGSETIGPVGLLTGIVSDWPNQVEPIPFSAADQGMIGDVAIKWSSGSRSLAAKSCSVWTWVIRWGPRANRFRSGELLYLESSLKHTFSILIQMCGWINQKSNLLEFGHFYRRREILISYHEGFQIILIIYLDYIYFS